MRGGTVAESSDERDLPINDRLQSFVPRNADARRAVSVCPPDDSRGWGGAAPVVVLPALRTGDRHIPADAILERGGGQSDHLRVALMPYRAARPCTKPGCPALVRGSSSRCPAHAKHLERPTSSAQGYGADWRKLRAAHLAVNPTCVACGAAAVDVDHIQAHRGNETLRLDPANLQSFCRSCHSKKTARVDHGFGRMPTV
jgi:5-methylcytosine-specific restriction protein A